MTKAEFEHIIPQLVPLMWRVGMDFFRSPDDADDVVQESMLNLWQYCERIEAERNVDGLAVRVAKNVCVSIHRRRHCERFEHIGSASSAMSGDASPHEQMEHTEIRAMMSEVVARLKPRERQLFEMRQIEGLSLDEITEQTGVAKPSAKAMISAARRKVMEEMKRRLKL